MVVVTIIEWAFAIVVYGSFAGIAIVIAMGFLKQLLDRVYD